AEQIKSLFNDGVLPEVNYDDAKVVDKTDSEFEEGKYGKSYDEIRKEQDLDTDDSEDTQENHSTDDDTDDNTSQEDTGHEQAPNIDKPSNPSDPNDPSTRN
ncbi:zinc metalloprotease, partial [Staphylococcus arlettae]